MKKLNLKQPKYIFPLVVFLPLTFLAYEVSTFFDGGSTTSSKVATDSLNMELPDPANEDMKDKMAGMEDRNMGEDGYSAVDGLGEETQAKDSPGNGYNEGELDQIDKDNAERRAQQKAQEDMERSQGSISTPMPMAAIRAVAADLQEGAAAMTSWMTMPRSWNTFRSAVRPHREPLMRAQEAMAVTETTTTAMMKALIRVALPKAEGNPSVLPKGR